MPRMAIMRTSLQYYSHQGLHELHELIRAHRIRAALPISAPQQEPLFRASLPSLSRAHRGKHSSVCHRVLLLQDTDGINSFRELYHQLVALAKLLYLYYTKRGRTWYAPLTILTSFMECQFCQGFAHFRYSATSRWYTMQILTRRWSSLPRLFSCPQSQR